MEAVSKNARLGFVDDLGRTTSVGEVRGQPVLVAVGDGADGGAAIDAGLPTTGRIAVDGHPDSAVNGPAAEPARLPFVTDSFLREAVAA